MVTAPSSERLRASPRLGPHALALLAAWCLWVPPATGTVAPAFFDGGTFSAWPPSGTPLPTNGRLVLVGDRAGSRVLRATTQRPLRLAAADDTVPVRVVWVSRGDLYSQALLVPERRLRPDRVYGLEQAKGSGDTEFEPVAFGTYRSKQPPVTSPGRWPTASRSDRRAPRWDAPPRAEAPECGVARHGDGCRFIVNAAVHDAEGDVRVRVELPGEWGRTLRFFLPVVEGRLAWVLGSEVSMYRPHNLGPHQVVVTAVDLAGNEAPAPGGTLRVPAARRRLR